MPSLGFTKKELTGPHPKTRGINLLLGSTAMGEASSFSAGAHGPCGRRHRALGREPGAAFQAVPTGSCQAGARFPHSAWRPAPGGRVTPSFFL